MNSRFNILFFLIALSTISGPSFAVSASTLSVRVQGNHLIDANGDELQLRGVSVSGLESTAIGGGDPSDPFGGQTPNWNAIKAWHANAVRFPLNEASWLGRTCIDSKTGASRSSDPGKNYVATVVNAVHAATSAGMYVILDLQISAPANFCPMIQAPMADAQNSIAFWTSVAQTFKSAPNVMFELFNEPFVNEDPHFTAENNQAAGWAYLELGQGSAAFNGLNEGTLSGATESVTYNWQGASMQSMLNAVRATGATNVVLAAGVNYAQSLEDWLLYRPVDSLHQLAASWHALPTYGAALGSAAAAQPNFNPQIYTQAQDILNNGYPVVISETGDHNSAGTAGAPLLNNLLPWADAHNVSYFAANWDMWSATDNVLIKDAAGDPTDGYGVYLKQYFTCRATGSTPCAASTPVTPPPVTPPPVTPPPPPTKAAFWVYHNGVFNWGGDYSSAAVPNYFSTAGEPESGSFDIALTLTGQWGIWAPYAGGTVPMWDFDSTGYNYITLDLKPTVANQVWQFYFMQVHDVQIIGANGKQIMINIANYGPAPVVGKWATYKIPLSVVLTQYSSGKPVYETGIYKFGLQDETNLASNTYYIDNVGFIQ
jgi:hypothetical protein